MATTHKTIHGIACNTADWYNCEKSLASFVDATFDNVVQKIMHHTMKDCISIPWLFSYNYQILRKTELTVETARYQACVQVLKALDALI